MKYEADTIAAISTPLGEGGIGVIRISGPQALAITEKIFTPAEKPPYRLCEKESHTVHFGYLNWHNELIDEVLVTVFKSPRSYTSEDVIEISCHGGKMLLEKILAIILSTGVRLAQPGEFTKRAFLNGKMDLAQAEAVADLIQARTESQQHVAMQHLKGKLSGKIHELRETITDICALIESSIDFPEDEIPPVELKTLKKMLKTVITEIEKLLASAEKGRWIQSGVKTVLVGRPNTGKSTLLNAIIEEERAIVTDIPGTTRDVIEEEITLDGLPFRIADTAGIRNPRGKIELEGVKRSKERIQTADLVLWLLDASKPLSDEDKEIYKTIRDKKYIVVINKADLKKRIDTEELKRITKRKALVEISALKHVGVQDLVNSMLSEVIDIKDWHTHDIVLTNLRHQEILTDTVKLLKSIEISVNEDFQPELISIDIQITLDKLSEIVGIVTSEDVLDRIFEKFCIGK